MKIIDAHTHWYPRFAAKDPEAWAKSASEQYWSNLVGKRPDGKLSLQGFPDEKKFLDDMDAAGVERAVIQGWYWENGSTCRLMNEEVAKFARAHRDRISAFAAVQPSDPDEAVNIAERARDMGFSGLGEIHNGVQKFDFLSHDFAKFMDAAERNALPVCIHLTERSTRQYIGKIESDIAGAVKLAEGRPKAKFIFAHWCGGEIFENSDIAKKISYLPNIFYDSAATPLMYDFSVWTRGISFAPNRALYGSDYPIRLYPRKSRIEEMRVIVEEAANCVPTNFTKTFFGSLAEILIKIK